MTNFVIGGKYNWKGQPERLIYLGYKFSGNGYWHQFALVEKPDVVWCEVQGYELQYFEETVDLNTVSEKVEIVTGRVNHKSLHRTLEESIEELISYDYFYKEPKKVAQWKTEVYPYKHR